MYDDKTVNGTTKPRGNPIRALMVAVCTVAVIVAGAVGVERGINGAEADKVMHNVVSLLYDTQPALRSLIREAMADDFLSVGDYKQIKKAKDNLEILAFRAQIAAKITRNGGGHGPNRNSGGGDGNANGGGKGHSGLTNTNSGGSYDGAPLPSKP